MSRPHFARPKNDAPYHEALLLLRRIPTRDLHALIEQTPLSALAFSQMRYGPKIHDRDLLRTFSIPTLPSMTLLAYEQFILEFPDISDAELTQRNAVSFLQQMSCEPQTFETTQDIEFSLSSSIDITPILHPKSRTPDSSEKRSLIDKLYPFYTDMNDFLRTKIDLTISRPSRAPARPSTPEALSSQISALPPPISRTPTPPPYSISRAQRNFMHAQQMRTLYATSESDQLTDESTPYEPSPRRSLPLPLSTIVTTFSDLPASTRLITIYENLVALCSLSESYSFHDFLRKQKTLEHTSILRDEPLNPLFLSVSYSVTEINWLQSHHAVCHDSRLQYPRNTSLTRFSCTVQTCCFNYASRHEALPLGQIPSDLDRTLKTAALDAARIRNESTTTEATALNVMNILSFLFLRERENLSPMLPKATSILRAMLPKIVLSTVIPTDTPT